MSPKSVQKVEITPRLGLRTKFLRTRSVSARSRGT